jgi:uncharacterized protein YecE (DUF72 family)
MDFGAVSDPTGIDFSIPPLSARWPAEPGGFVVRTGAPMWGEKLWSGPFYPDDLPTRSWLGHYATRLGAVEHNGTFYALPSPALVAGWVAATPATFRMCPKVPRSISHDGPWREDAPRFGELIRGLGERLGPCLFQVPAEVGPEHLGEIITRVEALGRDLPVAVEVRHPAFFRGGLNSRLAEWLHRTDRIAVITDTPGHREVAHATLPTPRLYLRYRTAEGHAVDLERIEAWASRIADWRKQGLREAWVFVHQHDVVGLLRQLERVHSAFNVRLRVGLPTTLVRPAPLRLFP